MTPPDLNTGPAAQQASPRFSHSTATVMGPPSIPPNSSVSASSSTSNAINAASTGNAVSGPIRHPKPLTAAEMHLELEKEQESIVNRLTRELTALRAQTASVASTTSSTSDIYTSASNQSQLPDYPHNSPYSSSYQPGTGASIIPTSARRHRSSSNLSARSARSIRDSIACVARDAGATSVSGVAAPRDQESQQRASQTSARQSLDAGRPQMSRQSSTTSFRDGGGGGGGGGGIRSASAQSPLLGSSHGHGHRMSISSISNRDNPSYSSQERALGLGMERTPSFGSAAAHQRYEEAALQRQELESVKKENESLKQRIRDLEKALQAGRQGSAS